MIVDAHTHLGEVELYGTSLDLEGLIDILDDPEIQKAVVSSSPNGLTKKAVENYPHRLLG
jgi:hypothetical protein